MTEEMEHSNQLRNMANLHGKPTVKMKINYTKAFL